MDDDVPPTVLVVDDEPLLRMDATDILERQGFSTLEARNAEEALEILSRRPDVRVLFTDVSMPGAIDGLGLAERVHQRWPNVLLVVTSSDRKIGDVTLPDDGRFIAKPYPEDELRRQISDLLETHKPG